MSTSPIRLVLPLLLVAGWSCVTPTAPPNSASPTPAFVTTDAVAEDSDDPAIWIHPTDPSKSLIIGTDKGGGLYTFNLQGKILSDRTKTGLSRPNNIDIEQRV